MSPPTGTLYNFMFLSNYVFLFKMPTQEEAKSNWWYFLLFSMVRFQMSLQIACMRWCIVTLVAFVWFFSTVHFQMGPQIVCTRGCIFTLVAFVWPHYDFYTCICYTQVIFRSFKSVLDLCPTVASNWGKFRIMKDLENWKWSSSKIKYTNTPRIHSLP